MLDDPRVAGFVRLIRGALPPPRGAGRIALALAMGAACHLAFAAGVLAMIVAMFFGMSESLGQVPWPWAALANAALIVQFPLVHSAADRAGRAAAGAAGARPAWRHAGHHHLRSDRLAAASGALRALDAVRNRLVARRGRGVLGVCAAYTASWLVLIKASFDAGAEVQSGALGWMSLLGRLRPKFPDMPTLGLFRVIRQPIYVGFALTLWTVPVWTPDQLALAVSYTAYCLLAPRLKERRFAARYGARFERYRAQVPYILPTRRRRDAQ